MSVDYVDENKERDKELEKQAKLDAINSTKKYELFIGRKGKEEFMK